MDTRDRAWAQATESGKKFRGRVRFGGVDYHVGIFGSQESASEAAHRELEYARLGTSALVIPGTTTIAAFAKSIEVREGTVKRWVHEGMPALKLAGVSRIEPSAAKAWVDANRRDTVAFSRQSLLYVVQRDTDRAVKIGWTSNLGRRLNELTKGTFSIVRLLAAWMGDKPRRAGAPSEVCSCAPRRRMVCSGH